MNYQPFSAIAIGNTFHLVNKPAIRFMKCAGDQAVLLDGYWENNQLRSRGSLTPFKADTCIVAVTEGEVILSAVKVDPIDPRRHFWKAGDQRCVDNGGPAKVNIFGGLFLYHGFGMGNYYSATGEVLSCTVTEAREHAAKEEVPFVYFDTFRWTNDPELKRERAAAQAEFDESKARSAQTPVSAVAEMA